MNYKEKYFKMRDLASELICLCQAYAPESETLKILDQEFETIDEN